MLGLYLQYLLLSSYEVELHLGNWKFKLVMRGGGCFLASFLGPARSSLSVRNSRRGPGLVHHVMCATAYVTAISLRINDVIGWARQRFTLKEAPRDHSDSLYASLANCYKSWQRGSKAVILSWI